MLVSFSLGEPPSLGHRHWAEAFSFSSAFGLFGILSLSLLPSFAGRENAWSINASPALFLNI